MGGARTICFSLVACVAAWPSGAVRAGDGDAAKPIDSGPTLITLHVADAPLADIVSKIAAQTGMPIIAEFENPLPPLSLDADHKPFWNVMDDLGKRTHSSIVQTWNGKPELALQLGETTGGERIISGPVLLQFQSVEHVDAMTAAPERQDCCEVRGMAMWEPRLPVLFTDAWTAPTVAEDENGNSLVPDESTPGIDSNGYGRQQNPYGRYVASQRFNNFNPFGRDVHIRLHVTPTAGRRIKHLAGKWALFVAGKTDHFDVSPIAGKRNTSYELGDLGQMKLTYSQADDGIVQLQFTVSGGNSAPSDAAARRNCLLQSMHARAVDASGHTWGDTAGENNESQMNVGMGGGMTYINIYIRPNAGVTGRAVKVTIDGPVTATEIDAPFDLHDLPLP